MLYVYACILGHSVIFMHDVEFVWFICISVWILFVAYKKTASRPVASCANWQVNHVSVGRISACVCLRKIQNLSLEAACDRGSSVLLTAPAPTDHWWEDRGSAFSRWREIHSSESEPNYRAEFTPNKTLQHVCGNEELCFCARLICQWPPPNCCWLGWITHCCWCLQQLPPSPHLPLYP